MADLSFAFTLSGDRLSDAGAAEADQIVKHAGWSRAMAELFIRDAAAACGGRIRVGDIAPLFAACRRGLDDSINRVETILSR